MACNHMIETLFFSFSRKVCANSDVAILADHSN